MDTYTTTPLLCVLWSRMAVVIECCNRLNRHVFHRCFQSSASCSDGKLHLSDRLLQTCAINLTQLVFRPNHDRTALTTIPIHPAAARSAHQWQTGLRMPLGVSLMYTRTTCAQGSTPGLDCVHPPVSSRYPVSGLPCCDFQANIRILLSSNCP